ncbi:MULTISPECIES: class I SAM-dependent methyltransferase [Desulfococcus]|jgi:demethylmenaquinone methyltransferase/2-methoxy-6-polyprenyl-1,4-benzoquinol methylase|uniref:Methyltransferase type 11 n=1 Tax=Desulfococcus multivorans DSM 2059 TaxID=1121405 RepID=S7TPY7_DESML|nr:class I SAM-dependent methyltransferase [Desulfococcus multivorans]AOY57562.1 methyltransferase, type 11 [Desulfococcus multivorans]EPR39262.1 Methyltransferase type 11 [Desulfococcus multivorans DSM 2059]SKA11734.1 demethylmenaquinone methyltransferase / 2-methoxy-6-polyprenyl-1,4-benzoquinol methylase [Desulfococcus multivorans DSM 2059]
MIDHFRFAAPVYDRLLGPPDRRLVTRLLRLPARGMLLDAGGGTGRVSTHLRNWVDGLVVSDLSRPMLAEAVRKDLWAVSAAAECLPFPDAAFDRILVVDALHHFRRQEVAVAEFARILKPGGRLLIEEPDLRRITARAVALVEKLLLMHSRFHPPSAIIGMMHESGISGRIAANGFFRVWITGDKPEQNPGT